MLKTSFKPGPGQTIRSTPTKEYIVYLRVHIHDGKQVLHNSVTSQ